MVNPLISLTVSVRDGKQWIHGCMSALAAQTYRPLEIIAVDDGSIDGSREELLNWHDPSGDQMQSNGIPIRVLTQAAEGLSAGRNLALNQAKGEWVAITDIDCRPQPDWLELMQAESEGFEAVTGRVVFDEGTTIVSRTRARMTGLKYANRGDEVTLANGPCSMYRREGLIQRGGFDPSWFHAEDMEVSIKILKSGGKIKGVHSAVVNHVAEESLRLFLAKRRRDARAHIRILRTYKSVGFDFILDAALCAFLFPVWLFILISLAYYSGIDGISYSGLADDIAQFWIIMLSCFAVATLLLHVYILWGAALWFGAIEGCFDALFSRHGHKRLFTKRV